MRREFVKTYPFIKSSEFDVSNNPSNQKIPLYTLISFSNEIFYLR